MSQGNFGVPSGTRKVKNGDLVQVTFLPLTMSHFDIITGVVCDKDEDGDFFIRSIGKDGREIKDSKIGWYSKENVTILVAGYKQTEVSYKPLPNNLKL
jgi:hypothetical protein